MFKFGDKVKIMYGFYEGKEGVLIEESEDARDRKWYVVEIEDDDVRWTTNKINQSHIKKV